MSTVKATNFQNASSATANMVTDASGNVSFGGTSVMSSSFLRNRIINGDMRIDQRNAGASVTNTAATLYTIDRWAANATQASKFTIQRNAGAVTPPSGFVNYLGVTSSSAYSVLSGDTFDVRQVIEGLNVSDLAWGTASAATVTLSFWVHSSLTGTFGGALANGAFNRSYPFTYTISVANTWEQKTVTIAGDTSGTWLTTNGIGIHVFWGLGAGSTFSGTAGAWTGSGLTTATGAVSVVGTSGATFYVTGVQLEVGTVATPFERQIFSNQLAQCQRYFEKSFDISVAPAQGATTTGMATWIAGKVTTGTQYSSFIAYKSQKRDTPSTFTFYNPTNSNAQARDVTAGGDCSSTTLYVSGTSGFTIQASGNAATAVGNLISVQWASSSEL